MKPFPRHVSLPDPKIQVERDLPSLPAEDIEAYPRILTSRKSSLTIVKEKMMPPPDGGKSAWIFLFGACIIEGVTCGQCLVHFVNDIPNDSSALPYTYGVFRAYLFNHAPFEGVVSISTAGFLANVLVSAIKR